MSRIIKSIRHHLADPHSDYRKIAVGFIWVSLFAFIGKLAGAAKEMVVAWRYGVSETVDAYVFVVNLISVPVSIWFSVLTVILLPLVARMRNENQMDFPRFRSELLGLTLLVGIILGSAGCVGLPLLLNTGWVGFSGRALEEALTMVGPLSLLLPMGFVISLFSALLMAYGGQRNTLFEAIPALVILGALLSPPGWVPEPLIWGTVAGFALQLASLSLPLHSIGELSPPKFGFRSPVFKGFWSSFGVMAAGQALLSCAGTIDQFFATHLGTGAISSLSYANRLMSLIISLAAMAISRSTLPILSELAAKGKTSELKVMTRYWSRLMFLMGLIGAMGIWLLAPFIVELLYQRGAFTQEDTLVVAELARYLSFQLPFHFSAILLTVNLTSKKKYSYISMIAGTGFLVKLSANAILSQILGLIGIALSTTVMYLFMYLSLSYFIKREY